MKLGKRLQAEILKVYNAYWDAYLEGDVKGVASLLAEEYTQVGSAETEVFSTKKGAIKFLRDTIDQVAGKLEMRNRTTQIEPQGNVVLVHEFCDVYVLAEGDWIFYSKFRASTLMQRRRGGWKNIHQHSSFPNTRTGEGDNIATEKIAAENLQLREAVRRRTVELEQKNRELEIETALEKVRAIAMGMKKPGDMLEVCRAISLQLQSLGVEEIRNVQTAIFHESRGTYMNYEYYTRHKKTIITETTYTNHKVHKAFATKMLKGKGEVFITHIKGKKVKDWIAYQKTTNVFIDRFLEKASSLNYYWHSLGPVALGISTYVPLTKEELGLFKRFLNVFELAYTRHLDIEQALGQAREAQIEASLERVHARSMAMHSSDELVEAADVVFQQLKALGIESIRTGIATFDETKETMEIWSRAHAGGQSRILGMVSRNSHPFFTGCYDAWKAKKKFFFQEFAGKEVVKYYRTMSALLSYPASKVHNPKEVFYTFFFPEGSVNVVRTEKLTDNELGIMQRFARVFGLMYRRFLDLQKAEAQARESQIQLAMERVRARTMAMQRSDELPGAATILFQQVQSLGMPAFAAGYCIWDEDKQAITLWMSSEGILQPPFKAPTTEDELFIEMRKGHEEGKSFHVVEMGGKKLVAHYQYMRTLPVVGEIFDSIIEAGHPLPTFQIMHHAYFSKGFLLFITYEPVPEAQDIFKRFAKVFEQTYTRFLDLQKAEAQAREAQIETALERVRSRTMAMHRSEEIADILGKMFEELKRLDMVLVRVLIWIFNHKEKYISWWSANTEVESTANSYRVDYNEHPVFLSVLEAWQKKVPLKLYTLSGAEKDSWQDHLFNNTGLSKLPDMVQKGMRSEGTIFTTSAISDYGLLMSGSLEPLSNENTDIIQRFGRVFQQSYTRYIDVQKAEAQTREAQIEAALEKVRTRTMSMQRSDELQDTAILLFQQMKALGVQTGSCGFNIWEKDEKIATVWMSSPEGGLQAPFQLPHTASAIYRLVYAAMIRHEEFVVKEVSGKELVQHFDYLLTLPGIGDVIKDLRETGYTFPETMVYHFAFFTNGYLSFHLHEQHPEAHDIFKRFAKVFEQTYTRYLDLQKAEAQTREAQIEAALERIRARAMAMHTSDELGDVAGILREQMGLLGQPELETSVIDLFEEGSDQVVSWYAFRPPEMSSGKIVTGTASFPWASSELTREMMKVYRQGQQEHTMEAESSKAMELFRVLVQAAPEIGQYVTENIPDRVHYHLAYFSGGALLMVSFQPPSEEAKSLQRRAASVFDMAYRRYRDLKKAEAQTREATIEASLEKVRGKAMAMHTSNDISETMGVVFSELPKLGIGSLRCGVALFSRESRRVIFYAAANALESDSLTLIGTGEMSGHPEFENQYECWLKQENYFVTLSDEALRSYYGALSVRLSAPYTPREHREQTEHGYYFPFSAGNFYAWSEKPYSDSEVDILERFKAIIELTFRRYLDLKKAEAQTREAQIEASLERVRSRTLAMYKSDELAETAAVLFKQLIILGIEPNRLYIAIIKDDAGDAEFWITDEDGSKVSSEFAANLHGNGSFQKMLKGWQGGKKSITIDMQGRELQEYFQYLGSLNVPFKGGLSQTRRIQNIAYFSRGFIGIASPDRQPEETTTLLERFAAVFNLTLTRFNDLKLAEAQAHQAHLDLIQLQTEKKRAEDALSELSATQAQLVQQEKLASLGQLTAGIAHEIKNPLNFVNNFSSVSVELLDEVVQEINTSASELRNGDIPQLLGDIKTNLTKIIEHGTRADGIVRSMLQHSRGGSGKKEPVDLNVLVKEYVNLAFHGMRASKSPINVDIVLDLDKSIGKVPVIAEDFSRVIINLCQNAFDAMREKFNTGEKKPGSYLPRLTVRTRREADKIIVVVGDNGPGIPDAIKDKILQPFFTTKKGTQGTGLGLSITHDIVKAHGGEMNVETNSDGGATFIMGLPA